MDLTALQSLTSSGTPPPAPAATPPAVKPAAAPAAPAAAAPVAPKGLSVDALQGLVGGMSPLPKPPSALGAVGDVLDLPFVAANALTRGGHGFAGSGTPLGNTAELGKVVDEIKHFGVRGLEDVNRKYGNFSPEQLADEAANGDPIAGWFAKNPKVGPVPVSAVADFVTEFANPANALLPPAVRGAGKLAGAALDRLPAAAKAAQTITREVAPYGGIADAAHTPVQGEAAGRYYQAAKSRGDELADTRLRAIFKNPETGGDLTREQRLEQERRSENLGQRGVVNPPRPVPGISDAALDKAAIAFRTGLQQLDREQLAWGSIDKNRMLLSSEYTPRYGGGHNGTYIDPNAPPGSPLAEYMENDRPRAPVGGGRSFARGTAGQGIHKQYLTHDEAVASGKLSPEYDPANALAAHFRQRLTNNELVKSGLQFRQAGLMKPLEYTTPFEANVGAGRSPVAAGTTLGMGALGHDALEKWAGRAGRPLTHEQTAANLGLPAGTRLRRGAVSPAAAAAQARESLRAAGSMGQSSSKLRNAGLRGAGPGNPDPVAKAVGYVFGQGTRAGTRATKLAAKYQNIRLSDAQAKAYGEEFNRLFPGIKSSLVHQGERQAEGAAQAEGFLPTSPTRELGPQGAHMAVKPELDSFLRQQGVPPADAVGMSKFIDSVNALSRMGIIANPFVHVLWNLNTQFMGAGGTLGDIAAKVWNPKWSPDAKWLHAAEKDMAIPHFSPAFNSVTGDIGYGKLIGARGDLSPMEKAHRFGSDVWKANNDIVFNTMETRYATLLYQQLVEKGMEGKAAGIQVRKALGDYANVSKTGVEAGLNKALFFYPWMKTVVPFWMGQLASNPQRINAPLSAIRTSNTALGDPNPDRQAPTSIYQGKWGGEDHYFSAPIPFRYIDDLLSTLAPQGDPGGGMTERASAAMKVVQSHANPILATGLEGLNTVLSPAEDPGGAALYTLWDKAAPPETQATQLATSLATKALPLPLQIRSAIEFLRELPRTPDAAGDALSGTIGGTLGGTSYGRPSAGVNAALRTMRGSMVRLVGQARKAGLDDQAREIYKAYIDAIHTTERGQGGTGVQ